ncbi:hypothetical protein PsorP6_016526 [Peronosclerospora sorghi]|uniref:Uncharacterized protein n=1 Tax=Peronosclerospora sorghi TaxID=230839 RepID=A0ACC0VJV2_9STRA|nr:hypothetical protein PsorP6_016526 [Peronosclerospora sorghi]
MTASTDVASASTESKLTFDLVQRHLRGNSTDERENEDRMLASPDMIKEILKTRGFPVDWLERFVKVNVGEGKDFNFVNSKRVQRLEHRDHLDRLGVFKKEEDLNVAAYLVLLGNVLKKNAVLETAERLDELINSAHTDEATNTVAKQIQEGQFVTWIPFGTTEPEIKVSIFQRHAFDVVGNRAYIKIICGSLRVVEFILEH